MRFAPETIHARLGPDFYSPVRAADFPKTILRYRNQRWAGHVGLDELSEAKWNTHFGRFEPLPGSFEQPLALRYHGHQFRVYNPDLGDGRGFLFAQMRDGAGRLLDLGTKGSGLTPYSRTADGRLTLKGGVREVLATAMLEAQGVYTSKSFSLIETGEALYRGDEPSPTRSSVLVRLSHSHIRIGTFQRLLAENDAESIERLVLHCLDHYGDGSVADDPPPLRFLSQVVARCARLAAQWMPAGFVHGVLNTDNINITGESFDYGPYRWLPTFEPGFTAAYFDHMGLYAFARQPGTLKWNLARLAECLTTIADLAALEAILNGFDDLFHAALRKATLWRLGVAPIDEECDEELVAALYSFLRESKAPYEQAFFDLAGGRTPSTEPYRHPAFARLASALSGRQLRSGLLLEDPYFSAEAPCDLLYDSIEALWAPIAERDDWSLFEAKLAAIEAMRVAYGA